MQPVQNIPNANAEVIAPANTTPASVVTSLPQGALYSPSMTPLVLNANLDQNSAVPPRPLPYSLSATQSQAAPNESETVSTLQTTNTGLGALLESLDTG